MKRKFVKLGDKAFSFSDPFSRLTLRKGEIKELETTNQKRSVRIKNALKGGHLEPATEVEFDKYQDSLLSGTVPSSEKTTTLKDQLAEMTKAELVEYYQSHYEVSEEDLKSFEKLKQKEMVEELVELGEE